MMESTTAFLSSDYDEALSCARRAIMLNPEVFGAHQRIYEVLKLQGFRRDAILALISGAVVLRDVELWIDVAKEIRALSEDEREPEDTKRAIDCYEQAIKLDPKRDAYEARVGKRQLHDELEDWEGARKQCKAIARRWPSDLENVALYARYCWQTNERLWWDRAKDAYRAVFASFDDPDMFPENEDPWTHLNVYLEFFFKLGEYQGGMQELRRVSRWILGRKNDTFWDGYQDDDREFDLDDDRRALSWDYQQGSVSHDKSQYGEGLPVEIRIKLGLFRMQMGHAYHSEAFRHFDPLRQLSYDIENFGDMFYEVAECLCGYGHFGLAIDYYEPLKALPELLTSNYWLGLGECYKSFGRDKEAEECYHALLAADRSNVKARVQLIKVYKASGQESKASGYIDELSRMGRRELLKKENLLPRPPPAKPAMKAGSAPKPRHMVTFEPRLLAKAPGRSPDRERASASNPSRKRATSRTNTSGDGDADEDEEEEEHRGIIYELAGTTTDKKTSDVPAREFDPSSAPTAGKRIKATESQDVRVRASFAILEQMTWPPHSDDARANQKWMKHASSIAVIVRQAVRVSGDRNSHFISGYTPTNFCGIPFPELHCLLCNLALSFAKNVDQQICYDLLKNVLMEIEEFRYHDGLINTTLATSMCCAMMFNDGDFMAEVAKHYLSQSSRRSGSAVQLLIATGRMSTGPEIFETRRITRFINDTLKEMEHLVSTPEERDKADWGYAAEKLVTRTTKMGPVDDDLDPGLLTLKAYMSNSHHGSKVAPALGLLFRALALQPDNIIVNLSIATSYIMEAMKRIPTNRQRDIGQGLAFLYRYYNLRTASGKASHLQEAEYNLARSWHQLGLIHLAMPAYDKVLSLSEKVQLESAQSDDLRVNEETEDFALEAAYALQNIYAVAGNEEAAQRITDDWLVL